MWGESGRSILAVMGCFDVVRAPEGGSGIALSCALFTESKQPVQRRIWLPPNRSSDLKSLAIAGLDPLPWPRLVYLKQDSGKVARGSEISRQTYATEDVMAWSGLDVTGILELALLLVAVGALAGFLAGLFGIGGGAVLVPVFYECFRLAGVPLEVRMPLCIGTSLAIIIPTSIRAWRAHHSRGAVDMAIIRQWGVSVLIGVILGSIIARYAPERLFKIVFVCVAWSAAIRLFLARDNWKFGDVMPAGPIMRAYGFFIGLLSTLMGV